MAVFKKTFLKKLSDPESAVYVMNASYFYESQLIVMSGYYIIMDCVKQQMSPDKLSILSWHVASEASMEQCDQVTGK